MAFSLWKRTINVFRHTTLEIFENATVTSHVGFVVEVNLGQGNHRVIVTKPLRKAPFSKCFLSTLNRKAAPAFSNSSCLKSVFQTFRLHDRLLWKVGLTNRDKAAFSNFSVVVLTGPKRHGRSIWLSNRLTYTASQAIHKVHMWCSTYILLGSA